MKFNRLSFDNLELMKNSQDVYQTLQNYKEEINKCLFKGLPIFLKNTGLLILHRQTRVNIAEELNPTPEEKLLRVKKIVRIFVVV